MSDALQEFLDKYAPGRERVVLDIDVPAQVDATTPFIMLRYGEYVMILNPMGLKDHLCVDVHSFVDGQAANAGVMGMTEGRRHTLDRKTVPDTSHGWPAVALLSAILGKQTGHPEACLLAYPHEGGCTIP